MGPTGFQCRIIKIAIRNFADIGTEPWGSNEISNFDSLLKISSCKSQWKLLKKIISSWSFIYITRKRDNAKIDKWTFANLNLNPQTLKFLYQKFNSSPFILFSHKNLLLF